MSTVRLVTLVLVLTTAAVVHAQFLPEIAGTASTLARGDAGVGALNEEATGAINPAGLPLLFRVPAEAPASYRRAAQQPDVDDTARLRLAYHPASALEDAFAPSLFSLGAPAPQVMIEAEFLSIDRDFLRDIGVQPGAWGHLAGTSFDLRDNADIFGVQYSGGPWGGRWGVGAGYVNVDDNDFGHISLGYILHEDDEGDVFSAGLKVSLNGLQSAPERATVDLGALWATNMQVLRRPAQILIGARLVDLTNAYDIFPDAGIRFDVGASVAGENVRLMIDVVDVFDSTDFPLAPHSGRRVNVGAEARVFDDKLIAMGGLADGDFSFGARGRIPILHDIPYLGWAFGHREGGDTRAELVIMLTPHITRVDED